MRSGISYGEARTSRLIRGAAISYVGMAGALIASILTARLLGVEGKGAFSLFHATVAALTITATLGISQGHIYHVSRTPTLQPYFLSNAAVFAITSGTLVAVGYIIAAAIFRFKVTTGLDHSLVGAALIAVPVGLLVSYQRQYFLVLHRFELAKLSGALSQCLPVCGYALVFAFVGRSVAYFAVTYVATQIACLAIFSVASFRAAPARLQFSGSLARRALSFGWRQYIGDIMLFLTSRLDFFVVMVYLGHKGLGIYAVAVSIAEIAIRLSNEIGTMLFPIFARGDLNTGKARVALRLVTLLGFAAGLGLGVFGVPFIALLYGPEFAEVAPALRWLLVGTVAWSTINVTWPYLSAAGRPEVGAFVFGGAAVMDLALNLLLLPRWGVIGACVSASASYLAAAAVFLHFFRHSEQCSLRQALVPRAADIAVLWGHIVLAARRSSLFAEGARGR